MFWTTVVPSDSVDVNLGRGVASLRASNVAVLDYRDLMNALFGGGPAPVPATVSFDVRWFDVFERAQVVKADQGFAGTFVRGAAQMEWSAVVGAFSFVSAPLATSSSLFAEIGEERNGVFFANA